MAERGDVVRQFQCGFLGFRDHQPPTVAPFALTPELWPNPRFVGRSPKGGSALLRLLAPHVPGPPARVLALPLFFGLFCGAFFSIGSVMVISWRAAFFDSWSSSDVSFSGFAYTLT